MRHGESRDQNDNRDVESMWRELFRNGATVGDRPAYSEALGGSRSTSLGLRSVEGTTAPVHGAQASQEGAEWGGRGSPNDNAVIERSFRTDEEEFFFRLERPARDHTQLNGWYQGFLDTYNTRRPHMGINMLTPKEAINLYLNS